MTTTRFVMTVIVIGVVLYDVVAIGLWGIDASVSRWFNDFADFPAAVFGVGYLCGHFFGMMNRRTQAHPGPWVRHFYAVEFYPGGEYRPDMILREKYRLWILAQGRAAWLRRVYGLETRVLREKYQDGSA